MRVRCMGLVASILVCLGVTGCQAAGRPSPGRVSEPAGQQDTRDQVHADLERELSLYSD